MLEDLTIRGFIKELSSKAPTPGGGAVASLSASLSAALNCMVFNLTIGKKIYENYDEEVKQAIDTCLKESDRLKEYFLLGIDKDAEAFAKIIESYKLPKNTEKEKEYRHEMIQKASKFAAKVPENIAENSCKLFELIWISVKYGNKNVLTDAGAAAIMAASAIEMSILNIKINLNSIDDKDFRNKLEKNCSELSKSSDKWKRKILDEVFLNI
ncbi:MULTISPECIES: cyclodeaminase/cyclohydrolase family protein [Clostridium]|uniref:cyclodeaminase/cyclohydrolase family protein n=1 Tax=Clostridium TaxID=1485 RepID=UPI000826B9D0|nr:MULTISPECIES: cyclodeaminase/cyclohydrolase family protein [Clostridium]PJI09731.1 methenyltetrahydrofolate cyclohydrolase [Clostridium sp. CT7]